MENKEHIESFTAKSWHMIFNLIEGGKAFELEGEDDFTHDYTHSPHTPHYRKLKLKLEGKRIHAKF